MKKCNHCGHNCDDSLKFCTQCGSSLADNINTHQVAPKSSSKSILRICLIVIGVIFVSIVLLFTHINNATTYLRLEPNILTFPKGGGSAKVHINYDGYVWYVKYYPDWIIVEEYDDYFEISVHPNTTGIVNEGYITIQSGKCVEQVLVQQHERTTYISLSTNSLHFSRSGGTQEVTISTDGLKQFEVNYPDFIFVNNIDNQLTIEASVNNGQYRSCYIMIQQDNINAHLYVTQGGICNSCGGSGSVSCAQCLGLGGWGYGMYYNTCLLCGGRGSFPCQTCHGTGERD